MAIRRTSNSWLPSLAALALCFAGAATQAQHAGHGGASAPAAMAASSPASASKAARKPRPEWGMGAAFSNDGALWWTGLDANKQLIVQRASPAAVDAAWKAARTGSGPLPLQWDSARTVDLAGDTVAADGESHPKILFGPGAVAAIAYTKPLTKPFTGEIRILHSTDGGATFSLPHTVHQDRQEITHRFDSFAFDAQGSLHAIWIDKRDLELAPKVNGKPSYRGAAIYTTASRDGGATFGADIKVADHSCECCRIATAQGADGKVRAVWRHVFEPNIRDHALAVLDGTPNPKLSRASFDDWRVDGCPHHGPGLASSADGGFHMVWFGIRAGQAGVRYARLQADGTPLADSVQRIPDDHAEHASVMAHGDQVAVVWRSSEGMRTSLKAWLSRDGGLSFTEQLLAQVEGENDFPRIVQQGARMAVLWRTPKEVQVHALAF